MAFSPINDEERELVAKAGRCDKLQAEVDMLRGVGCSEDGDGPCGVCLKCVKAELADSEARYQDMKRIVDERSVAAFSNNDVTKLKNSLKAAPTPYAESTLGMASWDKCYSDWWHDNASEQALKD